MLTFVSTCVLLCFVHQNDTCVGILFRNNTKKLFVFMLFFITTKKILDICLQHMNIRIYTHTWHNPRFTYSLTHKNHNKICKFASKTKAMDLPQNRLLGERRRASSTMHRSWPDFPRFADIRVNLSTHRAISSQPAAVSVAVETSVLDQQMKLIIQQRISVCILIQQEPSHVSFLNIKAGIVIEKS